MGMSIKEAIAAALQEMHALSAEELRAELQSHRDGSLAVALREAQEFLFSSQYSSAYPITKTQQSLEDDVEFELLRSPALLWEIWAANDNSYALAA